MANSRNQASSEMSLEEKLARLQLQTRRHFLRSFTAGLGTMFLSSLASPLSALAGTTELANDGLPRLDHS